MQKSRSLEDGYHGQRWTTWILWKGDKPSDIHRRLSDICGEKAAVRNSEFNWTVSRNRYRRLSGVASRQFWRMVPWSRSEAPKNLTAMYRPRKEVCWAVSCLVFGLRIIKLLQMRWVKIISERPHPQLHVSAESQGYERSYKEKNVHLVYDIIKTLDMSFFHKLI